MNVYGSASGLSGPITALAAASPRLEVTIFWRRTSGPCGGRKEGPKRPCVAGTWNNKKPLSASACKGMVRWRIPRHMLSCGRVPGFTLSLSLHHLK